MTVLINLGERPLQIPADADQTVRVFNVAGSTLYFGDKNVTTLVNDGSVAPGANTQFSQTKHLISGGHTAVEVFRDLPTPAVASRQTATFEMDSVLSVATGVGRMRFPFAAQITGIAATAGVAPTGASILVDVNKNGTTVFTTQASRPSIAAGANASSDAIPDVTSISAGDYLTADIDQVGSGTPGSVLTVIVAFRPS